ncbi:MAG: EamA family transporter [Ardenticatenaceae bacterium]|nr:EamA family transporter [Ardenticatenaceae bacterium]
MNLATSWQWWAILSALFAALTAIFAKVGVAEIDSNLATFVRTIVILFVVAAILLATGKWEITAVLNLSRKSLLFLVLSGMATGASWLCYFRALKLGEVSQVAPIDKLSVVLVAVFGALFLGEKVSGMNWVGVALIGMGAVLIAVAK